MTLLEKIRTDYEKKLEANWTREGRVRTMEMKMSEPTFVVIEGADGIKRPYPKEVSDIYKRYAKVL